jgi:phytoene synthase
MNAPVAESQAAIAAGSQSFAAAARLMPAGIREDTVMLYAWCRYADDVVDGQTLGSAPETGGNPAERLVALKMETLEALHGNGPVSAPFAALRAVARRHTFPERWPLDLIDGFAMDVAGREYRSLADTLDYSYHVAGVVGVMMARVMGARDEAVLDHACDLGLAFQLTNIARDVMDDVQIGRIYLPRDWLDEAGAEVAGKLPSPALYTVILRLLDAAEPYYASAFAGLPALSPRCAWSIAAAARIYRAIGTRIRKDGPPAYLHRIGTSKATKAAIALRALGDAGASRFIASSAPRQGLWTRLR